MQLNLRKIEQAEQRIDELTSKTETLRDAVRIMAESSGRLLEAASNLKSTIRIMDEMILTLKTSDERLAKGVAQSLIQVLERAIQVKEQLKELQDNQGFDALDNGSGQPTKPHWMM